MRVGSRGLALLLGLLWLAPPAHATITFETPANRVTTPRFQFDFQDGSGNVERLDSVKWIDNNGVMGGNLVSNGGLPACNGDLPAGWGDALSNAGKPSPVGDGTTGSWAQRGQRTVEINSSRPMLCTADVVTPVRTRYTFFDVGAGAGNKIRVERRFSFPSTRPNSANEPTLRPYIPRLPINPYSTVVHPRANGTLVTETNLPQAGFET